MYICIHIYIYNTYIYIYTMRRRIVVNKFCGETRSEEKTRMGGFTALNDDEAWWTIG